MEHKVNPLSAKRDLFWIVALSAGIGAIVFYNYYSGPIAENIKWLSISLAVSITVFLMIYPATRIEHRMKLSLDPSGISFIHPDGNKPVGWESIEKVTIIELNSQVRIIVVHWKDTMSLKLRGFEHMEKLGAEFKESPAKVEVLSGFKNYLDHRL